NVAPLHLVRGKARKGTGPADSILEWPPDRRCGVERCGSRRGTDVHGPEAVEDRYFDPCGIRCGRRGRLSWLFVRRSEIAVGWRTRGCDAGRHLRAEHQP